MTILTGGYSFGFWQSFFSHFPALGKNKSQKNGASATVKRSPPFRERRLLKPLELTWQNAILLRWKTARTSLRRRIPI
jgi:hypothetical protein